MSRTLSKFSLVNLQRWRKVEIAPLFQPLFFFFRSLLFRESCRFFGCSVCLLVRYFFCAFVWHFSSWTLFFHLFSPGLILSFLGCRRFLFLDYCRFCHEQ